LNYFVVRNQPAIACTPARSHWSIVIPSAHKPNTQKRQKRTGSQEKGQTGLGVGHLAKCGRQR